MLPSDRGIVMSPEAIKFGGASIATVFWTNRGFTPSPATGVVEAGEKLLAHLEEKKIIDDILRMMPHMEGEGIKGQLGLTFNYAIGNEYIEIVDLRDISYPLYNLKKFGARIFICNNEEGRRAKVVTLMDLDFKESPINAKEMVKTIETFLEFQASVCRFIYDNIPLNFELGEVIYRSNIVSVESNDKEIDVIIESIYDLKTNKFIIKPMYTEIEDEKLHDTYYVLLSHKDLISKEINRKLIEDEMSKHKVKQSNMIFYQENEVKVPAKTLNYEIEEGHRRITNLTKPYHEPVVTLRLLKDYLNLT